MPSFQLCVCLDGTDSMASIFVMASSGNVASASGFGIVVSVPFQLDWLIARLIHSDSSRAPVMG